ncbi:MAG: hypothetical protein ACM3ZA_15030 [Bacillota bacterium]
MEGTEEKDETRSILIAIREGLQVLDAKFDGMNLRLTKLEGQVARMDERLERMEQRLERVEQRLDRVEQRLDRVEQRLDRVEQRAERVEQRLDKMDEQLDRMEDQGSQNAERLAHIQSSITYLAQKAGEHDKDLYVLKAKAGM